MVYPAILLGMLSLALPFMLHNTGSWLVCRRSSPFFLLRPAACTQSHYKEPPNGEAIWLCNWYEPVIFLLALSVFYR